MQSAIKIVLVETTHPGNIGAAARAMKNMGLSRLCLVSPKIFPSADATSRASGADDLLSSARAARAIFGPHRPAVFLGAHALQGGRKTARSCVRPHSEPSVPPPMPSQLPAGWIWPLLNVPFERPLHPRCLVVWGTRAVEGFRALSGASAGGQVFCRRARRKSCPMSSDPSPHRACRTQQFQGLTGTSTTRSSRWTASTSGAPRRDSQMNRSALHF